MSEGGIEHPVALTEVLSNATDYAALERKYGMKTTLFGENVIPYPKGSEKFWWFILLCTNAFSGGSVDEPLISGPGKNPSRTPEEECRMLPRERIESVDLDAAWILDNSAPEKVITVVQVNPTSNFLDRGVYKQVKMHRWKLASYVMENKLIQYVSEVPAFLTYDLAVFANTPDRCIELQHKVSLRNTPANLLTIDKKSLDAKVDIHGKVFVAANALDLTEGECREIVIFCMGQAEASELKLKSWDKLKDKLQEEARKFAMSAQHIRGRKR